jgi:hypothetical protein
LVERGFDRTVQAPAVRVPHEYINGGTRSISSKYGTGRRGDVETPTFEGLPAEEFFQRAANRGGANKFSTPEFDSSYASAQKKTGKKAPSLAQTNPALFNEFEKWRKSIQQG